MEMFDIFKKKAATPQEKQKNDNITTSSASTETMHKRTIYSAGVHVHGALYEEVTVEIVDGKYYYTTLSMTDKFNAGGHREEIPKDFIINGRLDEQLLLDYIAVTNSYMETLSNRRASAYLCYVCRMPLKNRKIQKINNHMLCEVCYQKIINKHE